MCKKKKDKQAQQRQAQRPDEFRFDLEPPKPAFKEDGQRDYFSEYYRAYKNDYIDQYMKAYREFKDINEAIKKVDEGNKN